MRGGYVGVERRDGEVFASLTAVELGDAPSQNQIGAAGVEAAQVR